MGSIFTWFGRVFGGALMRFFWDDGFSRAAALAYATLFSLVPISALGVSMFRIFGVENRDETLNWVLETVFPPSDNEQVIAFKQEIYSNLNGFIQNFMGGETGGVALNTVSIVVLLISAVAILNTIESALNVIWRVSSQENYIAKMINFWAVFTLGPMLIAISFYWTTKFYALRKSDPFFEGGAFALLDYFIPLAVTTMALTLLFLKLPAARVRFRDAIHGALIAAILLELAKRGFAYYITLTSTYTTLYGVLATVPLFLFWLYIMWIIVLFGAEISYLSGSITLLSGLKKYKTELGEIGAILGLQILYFIGGRFDRGESPPTESEIAIETGSDPVLVRTCLDVLDDAGIIATADEHSRTRALIRSPESLAVRDIVHTFFSRRYQKEAETLSETDNAIEELSFLRLIREMSLNMGTDKRVADWTLADLIRSPASEKANGKGTD